MVVPIETIKELRSTSDGRFYREQFQLAQSYEERWLTIIYILEGGTYKTLHLIANTNEVFSAFNTTLRNLWKVRCELMSGLGNTELRQRVWEKQYWKEGEASGGSKLDFGEMETLCKRLNVNSSTDALMRLFQVWSLYLSLLSVLIGAAGSGYGESRIPRLSTIPEIRQNAQSETRARSTVEKTMLK